MQYPIAYYTHYLVIYHISIAFWYFHVLSGFFGVLSGFLVLFGIYMDRFRTTSRYLRATETASGLRTCSTHCMLILLLPNKRPGSLQNVFDPAGLVMVSKNSSCPKDIVKNFGLM